MHKSGQIKQILILVKTYPVLSIKHNETVCTAGIDINTGEWVRIYPVPFREIDYGRQYRKFQIIELPVTKTTNHDKRPESYKIFDIDQLVTKDHISSQKKGGWDQRMNLMFKSETVFTNRDTLLKPTHNFERSLAFFKPTKIVDLLIEDDERDWPHDKVKQIEFNNRQNSLFEDDVSNPTKIVEKIPYKFSYRFLDDEGKVLKLMIEDWEIFALYRNCLRKHKGNTHKALNDVRTKYFTEFVSSGKYDTHLILGTVHKHHQKKAPNPYVIVGVLALPKPKPQLTLGF